MRLHPLQAALLVAALAVPATVADARPRLQGSMAPHAALHRGHRQGRSVVSRDRAVPYGYLDSVPEDPRYGYEEAPYDPNYHGPGAEVFAATKAEARDSGLLHELAPDAKVSATGIVVGGGL